jgi:hypothetical protein
MPQVFKHFGLNTLNPTEYSLIQLGGGGVSASKPLRSQNLMYNTTVLLKIPDQKMSKAKASRDETTVNIWNEEESDKTIRYEPGNYSSKLGELPPISAATFNKLVDRLTSFEAPGMVA